MHFLRLPIVRTLLGASAGALVALGMYAAYGAVAAPLQAMFFHAAAPSEPHTYSEGQRRDRQDQIVLRAQSIARRLLVQEQIHEQVSAETAVPQN